MCIAKRVIHTNTVYEKVFFNRTTRIRKRVFDVCVATNTLATNSASLGVNWVADLNMWPEYKAIRSIRSIRSIRIQSNLTQ